MNLVHNLATTRLARNEGRQWPKSNAGEPQPPDHGFAFGFGWVLVLVLASVSVFGSIVSGPRERGPGTRGPGFPVRRRRVHKLLAARLLPVAGCQLPVAGCRSLVSKTSCRC